MGRSYWYECSKCGYRTIVSGRADRGLNFFVQTILCRDCRVLYDAVSRVKVPDDSGLRLKPLGLRSLGLPKPPPATTVPPRFDSLLSRLPYRGVKRFRWIKFKLQCPSSTIHRVQPWNEPDKCPRCGVYLERNALPYRIWE